jgi:hypothetical protein
LPSQRPRTQRGGKEDPKRRKIKAITGFQPTITGFVGVRHKKMDVFEAKVLTITGSREVRHTFGATPSHFGKSSR